MSHKANDIFTENLYEELMQMPKREMENSLNRLGTKIQLTADQYDTLYTEMVEKEYNCDECEDTKEIRTAIDDVELCPSCTGVLVGDMDVSDYADVAR